MALTIYGSAQSRALRVLWTATELGLDFEHIPLAWSDPALKQPDFLRINPVGRVPAIDDDGFTLAESLAINFYLTRKAGSPLYPADPRDEARAIAWTLWATYELESFLNRDLRRPMMQEQAAEAVAGALAHLEAALAERPHLLGEAFSVADLNVAQVLSPSRQARIDLGPYPAVRDWLARCYSRPACVAARRKYSAAE